MLIASVNPATGSRITSFPPHDGGFGDAALDFLARLATLVNVKTVRGRADG